MLSSAMSASRFARKLLGADRRDSPLSVLIARSTIQGRLGRPCLTVAPREARGLHDRNSRRDRMTRAQFPKQMKQTKLKLSLLRLSTRRALPSCLDICV